MNRAIPNINTARLTLRAHRPEDFDRYARILADPDIADASTEDPRARGEAWEAFLRNAGHWQMTGFGEWAIEARGDRRVVGKTGFQFVDRNLGGDYDAYPEASATLVPELWGQRLGIEAAAAAHDWFDRIVTGPIVARVREENTRGLALASRLGYRLIRTLEHPSGDVLLMRRDGPPAT